jgi:hypothetical protein
MAPSLTGAVGLAAILSLVMDKIEGGENSRNKYASSKYKYSGQTMIEIAY